ncbi:MAG: molybdopterin molybdotransferase MoeA [Deltaproteobacteria bacterium]|nr:molybdopterin molybdotransferase MoeA [Deltaproteobacteria bacterium]
MDALSCQQALETILSHVHPPGSGELPLDRLHGRVLAGDIHARSDDPPTPRSAMDGFALQSSDSRGASPAAPVRLEFSGVVGAGHAPAGEVAPGGAVRVMTGALIPAGADAVVRQEDTEPLGEGAFALKGPLEPGENITPAGAHLKKGSLIGQRGEALTARHLSLLAGQGLPAAPVFRVPRVGVLSLGDELALPGTILSPGQIHASNLHLLAGLIAGTGAEPVLLGIGRDDPRAAEQKLREAINGSAEQPPCRVIITTGGSHRGDFDFGEDILKGLGASVHFNRVRISVATSTIFGTLGGAGSVVLCFALPGPPTAVWLGFEILIRPALLMLCGRTATERFRTGAILGTPLQARPGCSHFIPARLENNPGDLPTVTPLHRRLELPRHYSLLANALIVLDERGADLQPGARVNVELLEDCSPPGHREPVRSST